MSKAVKSPSYRYDSGGGGGGGGGESGGGETAKSPRAPEAREGDLGGGGGGEWGFASAFLFALSLITTVGKRNWGGVPTWLN